MRQHKRLILIVICLIAILSGSLTYVFIPKVSVASSDMVSIGLSTNHYEPLVKLPPTLDIRFEPSGTHIKDGYLKIRLDFYPNPEDKSYVAQHVQIVDVNSLEYIVGYQGKVDKEGIPLDELDYQKWYDSLPKVWVTNPTLCNFVVVPPDITDQELQDYIYNTFYADVTTTIDDIISDIHLLSPFMKDKGVLSAVKVPPLQDEAQLITTVNTRLSGLKVDEGIAKGQVIPVERGSIDVGDSVINRDSGSNLANKTNVSQANSANANGTLDTVDIWLDSKAGTIALWAGTFSFIGNVGTCVDSENMGNVNVGSEQLITGLTITVVTGNYIGICAKGTTAAAVEMSSSGGPPGDWYFSGERIDPTDSATFSNYSSYPISLYGTGTEAGGAPDISESPTTWLLNGITGSGKANINTTYYANPLGDTTAPSATVAQGECQFLITNTSTGAIDLTADMSDFSGGSDNSTNSNTGSNGATSFGAYCWYSGETYTNKGIMKSSGSTTGNLYSNLAASTNLYWGAEVKTQSNAWTGGTSATSTITITATAH